MSPWKCKVCDVEFLAGDHSKEEVFAAMREHYKANHPNEFAAMMSRAAATRGSSNPQSSKKEKKEKEKNLAKASTPKLAKSRKGRVTTRSDEVGLTGGRIPDMLAG